MVTSSHDETLCIWDLRDGAVLKKIGCRSATVQAVIVSGDGKSIASGDQKGGLTWYGDTGESLTQTIKKYSYAICSLDFSSDRTVLATGLLDKTTKLWCTKTWDVQGNPIKCMSTVFGIRHLVNSLPSRQRTLSKYGTHQRGNAWRNSRQRAIPRAIPHSRGRPMAHAFSQRDLPSIPPYESGIHRYGSKSAILGEVILRRSTRLL